MKLILTQEVANLGSPGDVVAAKQAGFDHHICKPAELARIEELLSSEGAQKQR